MIYGRRRPIRGHAERRRDALKTLVLLACTLAPSWLRLFVWRRLGFEVARGARVSIFSVVVADHVDLGYAIDVPAVNTLATPQVCALNRP